MNAGEDPSDDDLSYAPGPGESEDILVGLREDSEKAGPSLRPEVSYAPGPGASLLSLSCVLPAMLMAIPFRGISGLFLM